jgi:hypothetical protein
VPLSNRLWDIGIPYKPSEINGQFHEIQYEDHVAEGHPDTISLKSMPSRLKYDSDVDVLGGVNISYSARDT